MEERYLNYIREFFNKLIEIYGFKIEMELKEGQSYAIVFASINFAIKIEKYFREFNVTLYKLNDQDNGVELFNLLEYIKQGTENIPESDYYRNEKDIDECFRKQLKYISNVIYENYQFINDYFNNNNYESNIVELNRFRRNKYPELYKNL
jgi:hypothetical protein